MSLILTAKPDPIDPREEITQQVSDGLKDYEVFGNKLIVALYKRKKIGSIITADMTQDEDVYQGKIGLVLQVGPGCFIDSESWNFHGQSVATGDWVSFRPSDGIHQKIRDVDCRIIKDIHILGKVTNPDLVH